MYPDKEEGCTEVVEELKSELSFYKTSGGESDNAPSTVRTVSKTLYKSLSPSLFEKEKRNDYSTVTTS